MNHQPDTARALLWRHGLPEDVIDGVLALHAQELAAVQRKAHDERRPYFHMGMPCTPGYDCHVAGLIALIMPGGAEESAGVAPATDEPWPSRRAGLRDEIAAALEAADYRMDMRRGDLADAVLPVLYREWPWLRAEAEDAAAVLPASVDRADVLREAADIADRTARDCAPSTAAIVAGIAARLRLMALGMLRPVATETPNTTGHACSNCEGIDPDTCLMNPDRPRDKTTLMRAHVALAGQAGHDQAALARVRQLHDRLAEETDLTSPDDEITRGKAAKLIATALDGWNPDGAPQCPVEFENSARCAKPAGHRPPGSDDPHVPTAAPPAGGAPQPKEADNPRTVCVCGHTRGEHLTVSGRLLCDACDPDSTDNLVCRGFDAL